ncbi:unnamed protein product [Pleuronectes platessa]|uniref:Uncharacterized protein n=1 Tax=Pleuronectes platessa TaxID=8262 RepID=A0A9N7VPS3_PLEPL|nr:unnamed protein product [Pleuronectes platessa]
MRVADQTGGSDRNKLHTSPERGGLCQGSGSRQTHTTTVCLLEEEIEAKQKFSQFLDEVASDVFDPNSLQAFGKPVSPSSSTNPSPDQPEEKVLVVSQQSPRPAHSMAQQQGSLLKQKKPQEEQTAPVLTQKTYLETDIDAVRSNGEQPHLEIEAHTPPQPDIGEETGIPPPPEFCRGFKTRSPSPEF